ncbi:MAG: hypothetical protein Q4B69_00050 [Slackia sp.]|nr:hypothetical protein [Slackia sp.]
MHMDYGKIRWFMRKAWVQRTYAEELEHFQSPRLNPQLDKALSEVIVELGLADKKMDGASVRGIPVKTEGKTYVSFAAAFDCCARSYLSPVSYISAILEACLYQKVDRCHFAEQAGRGLRAFPSFIREFDLRQGLIEEFTRRGIAVIVESGVRLDIEEHTDVKLTLFDEDGCEGRAYRLWSYLPTNRGTYNLLQKLLGRRAGGDVASGVHVLCPFPFFGKKDVVQGWYLHPESYFVEVADAIMECEASAERGKDALSTGAAVSYDDVICDPEAHVRRVCAFEKQAPRSETHAA